MKTILYRYVFVSLIFLIFTNTSNAQTYTFETCGATGRFGPTQGQVNATYTGPNTLTGAVTINTQGIQEWTVPFTGIYRITAIGASGGGSTNTSYGGGPDVGGRGARMIGDFSLTAGTVLKVLVGQMGPSVNCTPGGGGGSYVATITNTPLIVAGGGGGASSDYDGIDAVVTNNGTTNTANTAPGGVGGNGGGACQLVSQHNGGGGGGFFGNGQNGLNNVCGGISFVNGGIGGDMNFNSQTGGYGGFGGGGGSSYCTVGGGGGGGYSGGAGGEHYNNCGPIDNRRSAGGGGGSFNSGTNQVNTPGVGTGMGQVIITQLCPSVAPTLTCPSNITVNNDAGNCTAVVTYTAPTNGCATVTQTAGLPSGATFPLGTTTNTYQATNAFGTVTCSFTVTVVDAEAPAITCPGPITINTDAGQCTSTAGIGTATGTDNCGVPTITSNAPGSFPIGNTTVIWTATDGSGNIDTCHQIVTVVDAENPVVTCPADVTINTDAGQCTSTAGIGTATGTDNCGVPTITSNAPGSFPIGNTTVIWTATDGSGNIDTCHQIVTVVDAENPVVTCPADVTINTDAGQCTSTAGIGTATGTDNCGVPTITSNAPGSFPIGNTTVIWTATDGSGNIDTCHQIVTVVDAENPVVTCPADVTINTDAGQCTSTAGIGTATGTDNCGVPTITSNAPGSFPIGNTTVIWTATDGSGNIDTCHQIVTVVDAENPVVTCPADVTINTDAGQCTSTAGIGTATGTDNCGVPTITSNAPGSFPIGNTTVIWTATDGSGNIDTCHQIVTVVDSELPVITCPGNITVGNDPNQCSAVVTYTTPVGTDNCTGAVTTLTSGLASGSTFPVGTTTVTYIVTDGSNNVDSCSFTVTVADSIAPVALCKDFTLYLDAFGTATLIADSIDGGSTDDCLIDTLTLSQDVFTCSNLDSNNVTLYVTDTYGNMDSCTATVTVLDTVSPSVLCQDITLYLDTAGNVTLIPDSIDGGSTDNCAIDSFSVSQSVFTCSEIGANNVMLYVTDSSGNMDSCMAIVTVLDTIPPTVICPSDQTVETDVTCMYEIIDYTSLATSLMDNCDMNNLMITQDPAAGTMVTAENISNSSGQTMVTIIVQDMSGNIDSCDFVIDVECSDELEIPNVFTPNGDGTNDVWNLNGIDEYPDAIVQVFNRWGDVVFESSVGYTDPWDGTYNGTDVPVATYYYIIKLSSSEEGISGTINIVR
ncbi:MAG: HYR domain-containing protein [Vicingaceae bacterium]|nr:HYR domain-containing protein [Vicingaceae bacterium]